MKASKFTDEQTGDNLWRAGGSRGHGTALRVSLIGIPHMSDYRES
jgi:hypothetical protein